MNYAKCASSRHFEEKAVVKGCQNKIVHLSSQMSVIHVDDACSENSRRFGFGGVLGNASSYIVHPLMGTVIFSLVCWVLKPWLLMKAFVWLAKWIFLIL